MPINAFHLIKVKILIKGELIFISNVQHVHGPNRTYVGFRKLFRRSF